MLHAIYMTYDTIRIYHIASFRITSQINTMNKHQHVRFRLEIHVLLGICAISFKMSTGVRS